MGPASRFSRVITDERLRDEYRQQLEQDGLTVDIVKNGLIILLRPNNGRT